MYRVDRNNFYTEQKRATIQTPSLVSDFIFAKIGNKIKKDKYVLDPCVGEGSLLKPFRRNGFKVKGIDVEDQGFPNTILKNYLEVHQREIETPSLVIMNPPFNIDAKTKLFIKQNYDGRPLLPEIWLSKAILLFGKNIPIVLFAPYGLRLNQTIQSKRWRRFIAGEYPEICSIISLPKNIFKGVLFHSEILIFNIKGLKGHYFYYG